MIEWMDWHSPDLFLSAVTIAELADGIAKAKREGTKRKATELSAWLRTVLHLYGDRVLSFDGPTAEIAGALAAAVDLAMMAPAQRHGELVADLAPERAGVARTAGDGHPRVAGRKSDKAAWRQI